MDHTQQLRRNDQHMVNFFIGGAIIRMPWNMVISFCWNHEPPILRPSPAQKFKSLSELLFGMPWHRWLIDNDFGSSLKQHWSHQGQWSPWVWWRPRNALSSSDRKYLYPQLKFSLLEHKQQLLVGGWECVEKLQSEVWRWLDAMKQGL